MLIITTGTRKENNKIDSHTLFVYTRSLSQALMERSRDVRDVFETASEQCASAESGSLQPSSHRRTGTGVSGDATGWIPCFLMCSAVREDFCALISDHREAGLTKAYPK